MSNLRTRIERVETLLTSVSRHPKVVRVITDSRDPSTWDRPAEAEAAVRADGWTGPILVIDRRIVYPEARA